MDAYALWLGYLVMALGGGALALLFIIGFARLVNRTTWRVVDCYGGLKTLREFNRWYREQRRDA